MALLSPPAQITILNASANTVKQTAHQQRFYRGEEVRGGEAGPNRALTQTTTQRAQNKTGRTKTWRSLSNG